MSACLLIRIPLQGSPLQWVWLDKNQPTFNSLTQAADAASTICVLTPSEHLFLTAVSLPPLNPNQLLKAIPYALEDQLSTETHNLHFAFLREDKLGPVSVGVVSKTHMHTWLNLIQTAIPAAFHKIQAFIPDCLCLPYHENEASVLVDGAVALVKTDAQRGFAVETDALMHLLTQWVSAHAPQKLTIYYTEKPLPLMDITTPTVQLAIPSALHFLSKHITINSTLNLLQNEFAPSHKQIRLEQLVKFAVLLFTGWLALLTVWDIADVALLKREQLALNHEINAWYGLVHPNMALPDEPKLSLQKELASLRATHADSNFIRLISHLAEKVPSLVRDGVVLQTLTFRNNQIILTLSTPDLKPIEMLKQTLDQRGLKASLSNAERSGSNQIQVRLTVEELS